MIMYLLKLVISIFAKNVVDTYGDCIRRMYGDGIKQIKKRQIRLRFCEQVIDNNKEHGSKAGHVGITCKADNTKTIKADSGDIKKQQVKNGGGMLGRLFNKCVASIANVKRVIRKCADTKNKHLPNALDKIKCVLKLREVGWNTTKEFLENLKSNIVDKFNDMFISINLMKERVDFCRGRIQQTLQAQVDGPSAPTSAAGLRGFAFATLRGTSGSIYPIRLIIAKSTLSANIAISLKTFIPGNGLQHRKVVRFVCISQIHHAWVSFAALRYAAGLGRGAPRPPPPPLPGACPPSRGNPPTGYG